MLALMKEVLQDDFLELEVLGYDLHEDFERGQTNIACKIRDMHTGDVSVIEGRGVGIIDAFFHGLLDRMSRDYPSLETISIDKFSVSAKLGSAREQSRADAVCEVVIGIRNDKGNHFEFENESRSVTRAGINSTLLAAEYFVNSERAFVHAYRSLKSSKEQNRQDLVNRYTDLLAQLVRNTSYSEVIEQIREELEQV